MSESGPVVSNSGPLIALATVGQLDVLGSLYGSVLIPGAVFREVTEAGGGRPGALEAELSPLLFPDFRFRFRVDQRILGAGDDGDVGTLRDFDRAQRALRFFLHPLVTGDERDPEDVDIRRLQEQQDRLHIRRRRPPSVLIDDDLALR